MFIINTYFTVRSYATRDLKCRYKTQRLPRDIGTYTMTAAMIMGRTGFIVAAAQPASKPVTTKLDDKSF